MSWCPGVRRKPRRFLLLLTLAIVVAAPLSGQSAGFARYHSDRQLGSALDSLQHRYPRLIEVTTIAQSPGGHPVAVARLAAGNAPDSRPALLVIANAFGPHLIGSEIALAALGTLAREYGTDSSVTRLLDRVTLYVVPRANPDAAEAFFETPVVERTRNGMAFDDDRDGAEDEDGPEDLNRDGLITLMRVSDSAGEWTADSLEPWLMRKANPARGEVGHYRMYEEGIDNDHDERWNEDPAGGINVNRNFSYSYEFFAEGSGLNPMDAPEARAIAQFFVDHPNVAAVYVLGPQDNVIKPWEYRKDGGAAAGARNPLTGILEEDDPYFGEVAKRIRKLTGEDKGPPSADLKGDPLSFAYFHMGRWAWGSRGWTIPELPADTSKTAPKPDPKDSVKDERNALRWLRQNRPDAVVEWTAISHPDFPGRTVEVGGFRPFTLLNPPDALMDSVLTRQSRVVAALAAELPVIQLRGVTVERVSPQVFRVTAQVANLGYLPTVSQLGARVRWPQRVRLELKTDGQQIVGGRAVQLLDPVPGNGGSREISWLVVGAADSKVTVSAASPVAGSVTQTITLR